MRGRERCKSTGCKKKIKNARKPVLWCGAIVAFVLVACCFLPVGDTCYSLGEYLLNFEISWCEGHGVLPTWLPPDPQREVCHPGLANQNAPIPRTQRSGQRRHVICAGPITSSLGPANVQTLRETKVFFFCVAKLRICEFGAVSTYLPWQHGGNPSRAGEKINTWREAEGALLASGRCRIHCAHCSSAACGLPPAVSL